MERLLQFLPIDVACCYELIIQPSEYCTDFSISYYSEILPLGR